MRRGSSLRIIHMIRPDPVTASLLFLSFCFVLSGLLGCIYADRCDLSAKTAFRDYLTDYFWWVEKTGTSVPFGRCLLLYLSGVCAVFLLGFSSAGVVAVPLLSVGFGFLSFYTVSCFAQSFGKDGVILAAALIGLRLFFTLPCFFAVSCKALLRSLWLAALALGHSKKIPSNNRGYFLMFLLCLICLCIGVFCERIVTPLLFRAAVNTINLSP